jgi:hypothetical protein
MKSLGCCFGTAATLLYSVTKHVAALLAEDLPLAATCRIRDMLLCYVVVVISHVIVVGGSVSCNAVSQTRNRCMSEAVTSTVHAL